MTNKSIYKITDLQLNNDSLILNETIFHNANGYIGVRSNFEEGYKEGFDSIRGSYINGFYDFVQMSQAEKLYGLVEEKQTMLNLVDSQGIVLQIDDEEFSMFTGTVLESYRSLNMEEGFTTRYVKWRSPMGKEIEIKIKRMTSFVQISLFTIEYSFKSLNFDGDVKITSTHLGDVSNYSNPNDPRVAGESFQHLVPVSCNIENDISYIVTDTSKSNLRVCTAVKNQFSKACKNNYETCNHNAVFTLNSNIAKNEELTLTKYTVFSDSLRTKNCIEIAKKEIEECISKNILEYYKLQKDYLTNYWDKAELEIDGDDDLNIAVRYNLYQLIQSVGKDEHSNIAAKGLSGEGYEGHFFWDTEMYIQPFFTLTNPHISKNLIEYRYSILNEARDNAKILGHEKGALFPWRTIMGKECSGYFPSGSAQYHINGDIAYSIIAYYLATKDFDFIAEKGAEILFETSRLWINMGNYYKEKFHINDVTGPDEYTCLVNNNYFTNVSAQYNFHWAVIFYNMLKKDGRIKNLISKIGITEDEIKEFEKAEKNMFLPYDEELKINPQDDSFLSKKVWDIENTPKDKFPLLLHYHPMYLYRHQVCKQADTVLSHFVFEDAQSLETIRNSFLYYEKVTTHDSSLSTCIYSIVASKLGLIDKAYMYFGDSAKLDLFNTHHNTKDGIHTANMGGNYMSIVYGFGGLRLKEKGLFFSPILPEKWNGYKFKINYENSLIEVNVRKSETTFTLLSGKSKTINVFDNEYILCNKIVVENK